jgi:hypothetical protein
VINGTELRSQWGSNTPLTKPSGPTDTTLVDTDRSTDFAMVLMALSRWDPGRPFLTALERYAALAGVAVGGFLTLVRVKQISGQWSPPALTVIGVPCTQFQQSDPFSATAFDPLDQKWQPSGEPVPI